MGVHKNYRFCAYERTGRSPAGLKHYVSKKAGHWAQALIKPAFSIGSIMKKLVLGIALISSYAC